MSGLSLQEAPAKANGQIAAEKRAEPRYSCQKLVRIRPVTVPETSFRLSLVQNLSANGIGLLLTNPVATNTLLEIELQGRSPSRRIARVVHCTKHDSGWLVGCTLNQPLSESELDRLLA
jgi:hypothetical protein